MSEHRGASDAKHKVQLPSEIQWAGWMASAWPAGDAAPFGILTGFVGDGAEVKIVVKTTNGKPVGEARGKIGSNRLVGSFAIPERIRGALVFEASLPKHGLKSGSDPLVILPPRRIVNARFDRQEVRRGEEVKLLADTKEIPDDTPVKITILCDHGHGAPEPVTTMSSIVKSNRFEVAWSHDYTAETADIATNEEAEDGYCYPKYVFVAEAQGASATSEPMRFIDWFVVEVEDSSGESLAGRRYRLTCADGSTRDGRLNSDGKAREENLPPGPVYIDVVYP